MTTVTLSETYDLSTKLNKMSLVAIHTPSMDLVRKTYPGLVVNNRFVKLVKCDVKLACASILPADPLAVGVESGKIAPQDMFNPILYKAVSNRSMSNFVLRMHGLGSGPRIEGESVSAIDEDVNDSVDAPASDFAMYYNLLANHKGFKIAHPQNGMAMRGLRPFVYEKYYNIGENEGPTLASIEDGAHTDVHVLKTGIADDSNKNGVGTVDRYGMFGKAHPMPAINTMYLTATDLNEKISDTWIGQHDSPMIMPVYCGLILLPPAKLHILYYRLVVRWTVRLFGIRPIQEIQTLNNLASNYREFYDCDYETLSKEMESKLDMVDTKDADIIKIMEGA